MASPPLPDSVLASASFSLGLGLVDPVAGLNSTGPLWLHLLTAAPGMQPFWMEPFYTKYRLN